MPRNCHELDDGTVVVTHMELPIAVIPPSRSSLQINRAMIQALYVDIMQRPKDAPLSSSEAFALTVYLAINSLEEIA